MTGVSRDTSGDEMARAMAAYSATPEGRETDAQYDLWKLRDDLRGALEDLLRIAKLHGQGARLPWREREQTNAAQQRGIIALTKLEDIERKRAGDTAARAAGRSRSGG